MYQAYKTGKANALMKYKTSKSKRRHAIAEQKRFRAETRLKYQQSMARLKITNPQLYKQLMVEEANRRNHAGYQCSCKGLY